MIEILAYFAALVAVAALVTVTIVLALAAICAGVWMLIAMLILMIQYATNRKQRVRHDQA